MSDAFDLQRYVTAQDAGGTYAVALDELRGGHKRSHWMWFVFPQLAGLGRSEMSRRYALSGTPEAAAYLAHPVLGPRLLACTDALLDLPGSDPVAVLGEVDAQKLRSSMEVFAAAAPDRLEFTAVLEKYFALPGFSVREIAPGSTPQAAAALLLLRPRWSTEAEIVRRVDELQRAAGYRLAGVFRAGEDVALAVAGFRMVTALAWGRYLYVDDLSTLAEERGAGHGDLLMSWLAEEGLRTGCEALHLDSGVGVDRATAHRLYMRHKLRISAHHFEREL